MLELLHYIVSKIVEDPSSVTITQDVKDDGEIVFNLQLPEEERGKIIGKGGMNIKSIRNIISIIAKRENKRVYIKVLD